MSSYLFPYVCFNCRRTFKKPAREEARKCPNCTGEMIRLYRKFTPPKARDVKQWKKVELLVSHGFTFTSIVDEDGFYVRFPRTLEEAEVFVRKYKPFENRSPKLILGRRPKR